MKNINLYILFVASVVLISCNTCVFNGVESPIVEEDESKEQLTTWQEQVKYAQKKGSSMKPADRIRLTEYTYRGKIYDQKQVTELLEQLFADSTEVVSRLDCEFYEIIPLKSMRQKALSMGLDEPFLALRLQLDSVVKPGMDIIDLKWDYNGRTVYSTAIASDEQGGIVYDHIGNMVVEEVEESPEENMIAKMSALKTRAEGDGNREIITDISNHGGNDRFGRYSWEYRIYCRSVFDGNGILQDRSVYATKHAERGWSCDAKINTIGGELGRANYHEFAWGYAYGEDVTVSVSWNGIGFSISGGGTGGTGSLVHRR